MNGPHDDSINRPRDTKGNTSLHELCTKYATTRETIDEMIAQGADINRVNYLGIPPLGAAIMNGQTSVARYLLERGAEPFFMTKKNIPFNALNLAATQASISMIDLLIEFGAGLHVNETGLTADGHNSGMPCLHLALSCGNGGMIDALASQGAYLNTLAGPANQMSTPLHLAAKYSQPDAIRKLVKAGADIQQTIPPHNGTAIHSAIEASRPQNIDILITLGADINMPDDRGFTPLMTCVEKNNIAAAKALLAHYQLDIDARTAAPPRRSAIMQATELCHTEMVRLLIERGADVTLTDVFNNTAADIAEQKNFTSLAQTLRTVENHTNTRHFDKLYRQKRTPPKQDG